MTDISDEAILNLTENLQNKRCSLKDYYQILGVSRDAGPEEIKRAYRALAKKYHPDENKDKENVKQRFQEITEAYKVLSDPEARKQYNAWGHAAYRKYASGSGSTYAYDGGYGSGYDGDGHCGACGGHGEEGHGGDGHCGACGGHGEEGHGGDGHCGACGHHGKKQKPEEPAPGSIRTAVRLTYQEVLTGAVKEAEIYVREVCRHCSGGTLQGLEDKEQKCPYCKGRGYLQKKRKVKVKLPPRCYSGRFFMLDDVLCEGQKVEQKNIVVIVLLEEQEGFERKDFHLYSTKMVSFVDMVLGGEIEIPTIEGNMVYRLKPGTQNGSTVRLPGKGLWMPPMVGNRGDQYVTLQVEIPKHLTETQEKALRTFGDTMRKKL